MGGRLGNSSTVRSVCPAIYSKWIPTQPGTVWKSSSPAHPLSLVFVLSHPTFHALFDFIIDTVATGYPVPPQMTITTVPLSTVFTAPASCSTSWTYEASTYNGITSGILLQNAVAVLLDTECFPPGFEQAGRIFLDQIFSPGACPQGYVTQSPLLVNSGTSTATCCSQYVLHQSQTA